MSDIDAPEVFVWQNIEEQARALFALYGFNEIRTPILERTQVFTRSIGDDTDIVQKEMYTFEDRGGRSLTMRPEGTAGVVRYLAGKGQDAGDARLFYIGPMFRSERPQAGRKRQFHQCGVEMVSPPSPLVDAECIALQLHLLKEWGLDGCVLKINTRGEAHESRQIADELCARLMPNREDLCADCQRRIDENILRVLDCKNPECGAIVDAMPPLTEFMSADSRAYFDKVVALLNELGLRPKITPRLVRGLDYYNNTVWEIAHPALGAQDALAGGGRYSIQMGKKPLEGVGFAMGLERVIMALNAVDALVETLSESVLLWFVSMGAKALDANFILEQELRNRGVACGMDMTGRSMKAQMRAANRANARFVVICGDDEVAKRVLLLKDMGSGEQCEIDKETLIERILQEKG